MEKIELNGKEYSIEEMSDNARAQLGSVQLTDQKISQLKVEEAILQTARNTYANALLQQLPELASEEAEDIITVNEKKYSLTDFSEQAKSELASFQLTNQKISQLKADLAIAQTARNAYAKALEEALTY